MIKKILTIKNVGIFRHGCPNGAVAFDQTTAIYADNARGKSTFTTVLRACHMLDATRLTARRTIDIPDEPEVELLFENGALLKYEDDAWIGTSPDITVFDSEFVEQNVYSGFSVRTDQRQALLDFALGDTIVPLKNRVEELSRDIQEQTTKIRDAENLLSGLATPLNLHQFITLEPIADAEDQINECQKRIGATKNAQQLNARSDPTAVELVQFDLPAIFDVLARQLVDIEKTAEATVNAHIAKYGGVGLEDWISQGQVFMETPDCPFCGQSVSSLELIAAYQSHFNTAYQDLKREVVKLETKIMSSLADSLADSAVATVRTNAARIEAWKDQLEVDPPRFNGDSVKETLADARNVLIPLAQRKLATSLEPVGTLADVEVAEKHLAAANRVLMDYNAAIAVIASKVADFKKGLVTEDIENLETEIMKLQASIKKQQPEAVQAYADYQSATTEKDRLDQEKKKSREQIDTLMLNTLTQYQESINNILATFGANFSIDRLSTDYRGRVGEPRTQYGLRVRNQEVKLGSGSDFSSGHSFSTTLSESDKRTLALAFFIARLEGDPTLGSRIVVLDDPVSSMDRNRRYQTIRRVAVLATKCKQLLVLSHDAYFIRELRDRLRKMKPNPIMMRVLEITRVENDYSTFGECDLDEICESDYYRHHRMVAEYVEGKSAANIRDIAKAIRPLLEGYLHRRFPEHIPRNQMFGKIIADHIAPATEEPLSHLLPHVTELQDINEYASQFHHDTNQDADSVNVIDAELLRIARQSLNMIYMNG
jgi:wobble nucleotide-excising tRNase